MNSTNPHLVLGPLPQSTYQHQHHSQHHSHFYSTSNAQAPPPTQPQPQPQRQPTPHRPPPHHRQVRGIVSASLGRVQIPSHDMTSPPPANPDSSNPNIPNPSSNANKYDLNPVGALQERFQSRGVQITYMMVQADGASHCPTFAFQVFVGEMVALGTGNSKKHAKHAAARAMLDKLDGHAPANDGMTPMPPVTDQNNPHQQPKNGGGKKKSGGGSAAVGNTIGQLQEICVQNGLPVPIYELGSVTGQPHQRTFQMVCRVGTFEMSGEGNSKKDAKRDVSTKMIEKLNSSLPNGGAPTNGSSSNKKDAEIDEKLAKELKNMKIGVLTAGHKQKLEDFYKGLNKSKSTKLYQLHRISLKKTAKGGGNSKFTDMLNDLKNEQKFDVTYVEATLHADSDEVVYIVQISTTPVAVVMGNGKDAQEAKNDAARNALIYLRIMTKESGKSK